MLGVLSARGGASSHATDWKPSSSEGDDMFAAGQVRRLRHQRARTSGVRVSQSTSEVAADPEGARRRRRKQSTLIAHSMDTGRLRATRPLSSWWRARRGNPFQHQSRQPPPRRSDHVHGSYLDLSEARWVKHDTQRQPEAVSFTARFGVDADYQGLPLHLLQTENTPARQPSEAIKQRPVRPTAERKMAQGSLQFPGRERR